MDGEFKKVKKKSINLIKVNITSKNDCEQNIEWKIRHVKERTRCNKANLLYNMMSNLMIKRMVLYEVLFINTYMGKQGITDENSPKELLLRWQLNLCKHCKYQFGADDG